ncbi:hypothetical protein [Marinithermofilum abyssi]|nr:hypothetical protein [Marinithermofilum abyssi]
MRRWLPLLLFLLVLVPHTAFADSALDNMLPSHSPANDPDNELYEQFDLESYRFDGYYEGVTSPIQETINFFIGWGMVIIALGVKMGIYLYQLAFKIPGFNTLARAVSDLVEYLGGNFFEAVMQIAFNIMGVYVLVELIRRRYADSMKEVGKSILLLSITSLLFTNMYSVLKGVNDFSSKSSDVIVSGVNSVKGQKQEKDQFSAEPGTEALVETSNHIWTNFVIIPWQLGEFGKTMKPGSEISPKSKDPNARMTYKMLSAKNEKQREDITKALVKGKDSNDFVDVLKDVANWAGFKIKQEGPQYPSMTGWGGLMARGTIAFFAFISVVIFTPLLLTLSLFTAGYGIGFLLLGSLAAFIFLYALWPQGGIWSVINWFKQWIGAGLYKIVAVLLLSLYLLLSTKLYTLFSGWGWFGSVLIQIALLAVILLHHKKVFKLFKRPVTQAQNVIQSFRQMTPKQIQHRMEKWGRKAEGYVDQGVDTAIRKGRGAYHGGKAYIQKFLSGSSKPNRPLRYVEPFRNPEYDAYQTTYGGQIDFNLPSTARRTLVILALFPSAALPSRITVVNPPS